MISKSGMVFCYDENNSELNNGLLYHYTTANGLCSILNSMSLKLSSFSPRLDDPVDGELLSRLYWSNNDKKDNIKRIVSLFRFLSMTADYTQDEVTVKGSENSLMWYMYGEKYTGACIVFNKNKLLQKIRQSGWKTKLINVKYNRLSPDLKNISLSDLLNETDGKNEMLYWKEDSWSQQREKRILCYSEVPISSLCDITGTVDHIILGCKFTEYENLAKSIYGDYSKAYGMFCSLSFSCAKFTGDFMEDGNFTEFKMFLELNPAFKEKDDMVKKKVKK